MPAHRRDEREQRVPTFVENRYRYTIGAKSLREDALVEQDRVYARVPTVPQTEDEGVELRFRTSPEIAGGDMRYT